MPRVNGYWPGGGASGPASDARYTGLSGRPLSVDGSDGWSAAGLGAGLAIRFHELGQNTADALRMDEPDPGPVCPGPRHLIEQLGTGATRLREGSPDIVG